MDKYLIKKPRLESTPQPNAASIPSLSRDPPKRDGSLTSSRKYSLIIDIASLHSDPALRPPFTSYHPKVVDEVRLAYLQNGPTRTWGHKFKQTPYGKRKMMRRFNEAWFKKYPCWLEYSIKDDAAYYLCCYLFKQDIGQQSGGDTFVSKGFSNWKKPEVLEEHEGGGPNSTHNIARGQVQRFEESRETLFYICSQNGGSVLSQALQRKDQDIVNAMNLVHLTKLQLQSLRNSGWDSFLLEVTSFCGKHDIDAPNMDDVYVAPGRVRRKVVEMPNDRHYRIDLFLTVIDMQARELDNRFSISSTELLLCMGSLCPSNSFSMYDKEKLIRFAEFYPLDFSQGEYEWLGDHLDTYISDMRSSSECSSLSGIGDLAIMMVDTKRDKIYPSIYRLMTLALTLPVATASVERTLSAMNIVKNRLRNRMTDKWMTDCLLVYVEKDILKKVDYETIMKNFQVMRPRREQI